MPLCCGPWQRLVVGGVEGPESEVAKAQIDVLSILIGSL